MVDQRLGYYIYLMKTLLLILIPIIILFCKPWQDTRLVEFKKKKTAIDQYGYKHRKDMLTLVKLSGKETLVRVKNENWPDNTEYIYNILKDESGRVILTEQIPYSESGDWYVEWKHYFDADGKTFAFSKRETLFDESVKGGVAVEEFLTYYDVNFKMINQSFRLTDKDDKNINRNKKEFNFRDDKYNIYKNADDCLSAYHVKPANR